MNRQQVIAVCLLCLSMCAAASEVVITRHVEEEGNVCIVAQLAATIYVDYVDKDGEAQTSTLEVGDNSVVQNSSNQCADKTLETMKLMFENDRHFALHFSLNQSTSQTCLSRIELSTNIDVVTFPGHNSSGTNQTIVFPEIALCTGRLAGA